MSYQREKIGTRDRFEVFKRDGFTCQYCGAVPPNVVLHVDHILPVSKGGSNHIDNLVTSCSTCNLGKSNVLLSSVPMSLEQKAEEANERRAQAEAYAEVIRDAEEAEEEYTWKVAEILQPDASDGWARDKYNGTKGFIRRLGYPETLEAAYIARDRFGPSGQNRFKYFCGICWRKIKDQGK